MRAIEGIIEIIEDLNKRWEGGSEYVYERVQIITKLKEAQFWLNEIED